MQLYFLVALVFSLVAVMFALQNVAPVQVTFLAWTFEGSLAVVLFATFILGAVTSVLVSMPNAVRSRDTFKTLYRRLDALDERLKSLEREHQQPADTKVLTPARSAADASRSRDAQAVRAAS